MRDSVDITRWETVTCKDWKTEWNSNSLSFLPFHSSPGAEKNNSTNEKQETGSWARIYSLVWSGLSVCVCFYMCVWMRAMNVPCEGVWKRPDIGCQAFLCLSSPSPPTAPSRWWMTANEKFPLLDCRLQPAAVRGLAICFPLQGPAGALGSGPEFWLLWQRDRATETARPGGRVGCRGMNNPLKLTNETEEIMFISTKLGWWLISLV